MFNSTTAYFYFYMTISVTLQWLKSGYIKSKYYICIKKSKYCKWDEQFVHCIIKLQFVKFKFSYICICFFKLAEIPIVIGTKTEYWLNLFIIINYYTV